jgi:hypothetical protein
VPLPDGVRRASYDGTGRTRPPTGDGDRPPYPGHEYDTSFLKHQFLFEKLERHALMPRPPVAVAGAPVGGSPSRGGDGRNGIRRGGQEQVVPLRVGEVKGGLAPL